MKYYCKYTNIFESLLPCKTKLTSTTFIPTSTQGVKISAAFTTGPAGPVAQDPGGPKIMKANKKKVKKKKKSRYYYISLSCNVCWFKVCYTYNILIW